LQGPLRGLTVCGVGDPPDPATSHGLVKRVTDPNGVATALRYDPWGQIQQYHEGLDEAANPVVVCDYTVDGGGRTVSSGCGGYDPGRATTYGVCGFNRNGKPMYCNCTQIPLVRATMPAPASFPELPDDPPFKTMWADFNVPDDPENYGYSGTDELLHMNVTLYRGGGEDPFLRQSTFEYDDLGRLVTSTIDSTEFRTAYQSRGFTYTHDLPNGRYTRVGPDGDVTVVQYDTANRVDTVSRGPQGAPQMTADYDYYPDGRVSRVTHGNATAVEYQYDAANRITRIDHLNPLGVSALTLAYSYLGGHGDAPSSIHERVAGVGSAATTFAYDDRGRLIEETRQLTDPWQLQYDLQYEYDQGGNRTKKTSFGSFGQITETRYEYDIDDVPMYGTATNRLMKYATSDTSGGGEVLLSTTYYFYNDVGNPTRVVTETDDPEPGQPRFSATLMNYAANGQAVTYIMGEAWNNDGPAIADYAQSYRREFRYDGARQRYMDAALNEVLAVIETQTDWTDYDGDEAYSTFAFDNHNDLVRLESWEPGLARVQQPSFPTATGQYFHADHLGTTRHMSVGDGDAFEPAAYTAFGEQVSGVDFARFGYAGTWGYQANPGFPFLHVGARYYDPATGRFLQRDPIGIAGGLNVYAYAWNTPTISVDPDGLRYRPPGATGPTDKGFTDWFWSKVHYTFGWAAGKAGMSFCGTLTAAILWERWEKEHWRGFAENRLNQAGDIFVAGKGWIDAHL